jgi:hypothetical protein
MIPDIPETPSTSFLSAGDWAVIVFYMAAIVGFGVWCPGPEEGRDIFSDPTRGLTPTLMNKCPVQALPSQWPISTCS